MKIISTTLLLFVVIGASAQMTLSLEQATEKALELNRTAQISELEIERAQKVVKETLAIGLPQVNAEGTFQHFLDIPTTVLPDFISPTVYDVLIDEELLPPGSGGSPGFIPAKFGTDYTLSAGASLSQQIFNGSYLIGLKAAKSYVEMSRLQKEQSDLQVKEAVAQAYHTVVLATENASILGESIGTLESTLREAEALYKEGFIEEQDVEQIQLTVNNLRNQQQNADRQITLTEQLLNMQIGLPLGTELSLSDDLSTLSNDASIRTVLDGQTLDISEHPDLKVVDQGLLLQELRIKELKSRYLPTLNGFLSYQQQAQRNEFNFFDSDEEWFPSTVWGVSLQVPIFSSGMKSNVIKQEQIELEKVELQREMASDGLFLAAAQARSDYIFAQESYSVVEANVELARSIRDKTRIKYQEGISSSFELNEMENQYLDVQSRRIQSSMNLLNSIIELKKAYNLL